MVGGYFRMPSFSGGLGLGLEGVVGFCWMVGSLGAVRGEERVGVDVLDGWSG